MVGKQFESGYSKLKRLIVCEVFNIIRVVGIIEICMKCESVDLLFSQPKLVRKHHFH